MIKPNVHKHMGSLQAKKDQIAAHDTQFNNAICDNEVLFYERVLQEYAAKLPFAVAIGYVLTMVYIRGHREGMEQAAESVNLINEKLDKVQ